MMFWSKLKTTAVIVLAGALLSGTALSVRRAMGRPQAPTAAGKQQPQDRSDAGGNPAAAVPSGSESPELEAVGKARIEVARKLRDAAESLWRGGEKSLVEYLTALKRCDEVVADVTVKTDADRVRFLERQVATLKQIELHTQQLYRTGQATQLDVFAAELARLDAEYALAKARPKAGNNPR